jgi:hypothetical protein
MLIQYDNGNGEKKLPINGKLLGDGSNLGEEIQKQTARGHTEFPQKYILLNKHGVKWSRQLNIPVDKFFRGRTSSTRFATARAWGEEEKAISHDITVLNGKTKYTIPAGVCRSDGFAFDATVRAYGATLNQNIDSDSVLFFANGQSVPRGNESWSTGLNVDQILAANSVVHFGSPRELTFHFPAVPAKKASGTRAATAAANSNVVRFQPEDESLVSDVLKLAMGYAKRSTEGNDEDMVIHLTDGTRKSKKYKKVKVNKKMTMKNLKQEMREWVNLYFKGDPHTTPEMTVGKDSGMLATMMEKCPCYPVNCYNTTLSIKGRCYGTSWFAVAAAGSAMAMGAVSFLPMVVDMDLPFGMSDFAYDLTNFLGDQLEVMLDNMTDLVGDAMASVR